MDYEINFLKALLLTILIETLVLFVLSKTLYRNQAIPLKLVILTGIITSMATLPYLWFIFPLFLKSKLSYKVVSELTAILVETLIIYGILKTSLKKSLIISTICNLASYSVGLIIGF
jgi:hypothetical protein